MEGHNYHTQRFTKILEADYGPLDGLDELSLARARRDVERVLLGVKCVVERRALVEVGRSLGALVNSANNSQYFAIQDC